jgi:hypothetical protein
MRILLASLATLYVYGAGAFCMWAGGAAWGTVETGMIVFLLAIVGPLAGAFAYNAKTIWAGL